MAYVAIATTWSCLYDVYSYTDDMASVYWHDPGYCFNDTRIQGAVAMSDIPLKFILNSNLAKSRSSRTPISITKSFWKFAQSTAVILSCSVQNFETIWKLNNKLWANEISRDLNMGCRSDGYRKLQQPTPNSTLYPAGLEVICILKSVQQTRNMYIIDIYMPC